MSARGLLRSPLVLCLLAIPVRLFLPTPAAEAEPSGPPSIILLLVDTLRWDYLGCYGFRGPVSPRIDDLAGESYLFRRCISQAPWTKPSIAALFTSLYPGGHHVTDHEGRAWAVTADSAWAEQMEQGVLSDEVTTLAEMLSSRGYRTAAFVANPWVTRDYGFDQGFADFDDRGADGSCPADTVLARAARWLDGYTPPEPFFLYLHFMDVHAPYTAPDSLAERLLHSPELAPGRETALPEIPTYLKPMRSYPTRTRRLDYWQSQYAAGVTYLDRRLGAFLDDLDRRGLLDPSIVILAADHGEELHDHGGWGHGQSLYEELIRVPLLIRPQGGVSGGRLIESAVSLVDLLPTLLSFAGAEPPDGIEGRDLRPLLAPGEGDSTAVGACYSWATLDDPGDAAIVVWPFKLLLHASRGEVDLFRLDRDPGETTDLSESMPVLARELQDHLGRVLEVQWRGLLFREPTRPVPEDRLEQLRSLGYLN